MSKFSRKYTPGDERHINHLYNLVTGTVRTAVEYAWEWVETWDGPGSVWLVFDDERDGEDQLIGQYSLIPTPLRLWGKRYLAGKTENCMSHPDFRGKGMYFYHEKEYFEHAKERFQLFFTTTGDVARGAPGKVRMKLGYRPFDYWITLSYWLNRTDLENEIYSKMPRLLNKYAWFARTVAKPLSWSIFKYTRTSYTAAEGHIKLRTETEVDLSEIEALWQENASTYGISVDRSAAYLEWRINSNPYLTHKYACYYESGKLLGYLIYTVQDNIIYVIDILAHGKKRAIFSNLLSFLNLEGQKQNFSQIKCYTASQNKFLIEMMGQSKYFNYSDYFKHKGANSAARPTQIFIYISDEVMTKQDVWDNKQWYITDLIKEGRPYTARPIE